MKKSSTTQNFKKLLLQDHLKKCFSPWKLTRSIINQLTQLKDSIIFLKKNTILILTSHGMKFVFMTLIDKPPFDNLFVIEFTLIFAVFNFYMYLSFTDEKKLLKSKLYIKIFINLLFFIKAQSHFTFLLCESRISFV